MRLQQQVEEELLACIGCNDCLLACPLPEAKLVTIAELNNAVQAPLITNPQVAEFVTACTQCRQCVPVCPADLSRADMVLFNKLKVEDVAPDRPLWVQAGMQVEPAGWTLNNLAHHLAHITLFRDVDPAILRRALLSATLRRLPAGDTLCRAGEYHERLFVILEGQVEQRATVFGGPDAATTGGQETAILVLGPGSFHGEMAVLADRPELYTVIARRPALVLELPKTTVYRLMDFSAPFRERLEGLYGQRAIETHLHQSPLLRDLTPADRQQLLDLAVLETVPAGHILVREGDAPTDLFLVRSGFLRVSHTYRDLGERVLLYLREGDTFGTLPLLLPGRNHLVTVAANTRSELICLPGVALQEIVDRQPAVRGRLLAAALESERMLETASPTAPPTANRPAGSRRSDQTHLDLSWTALIDHGVLQGRELLVIDQSICTDCNNCVDACGRRHGHSRLQRNGLQLGHLLFPSACRHCEDPVCLLCSVNGIVRRPDGQISIVPDNCIGCGACAERCPYDNISMHPAAAPEKRGWLLDLLESLRPGRDAPPPAADEPQIAVKCDLCAGYNDYACVTACPVGAAVRIDPAAAFARDDLFIGLEMKQRRQP